MKGKATKGLPIKEKKQVAPETSAETDSGSDNSYLSSDKELKKKGKKDQPKIVIKAKEFSLQGRSK